MTTKLSAVELRNSSLVDMSLPSSDNSSAIPNTAWVQALLAALLANSASGNGWLKIGAILIQWGSTGTLPDSTQQAVSFPISFPTGVFGIVATMSNNIGSNVRTMQCVPVSNSSFNIQANGSNSTAFWVAIGH